jgi:hypothetical protein
MKKESFNNSNSRISGFPNARYCVGDYGYDGTIHFRAGAVVFLWTLLCLCFCGCSKTGGYSNEPLFTSEVRSVYVEMFENESFRRGVEYELTDALAKRIEAETPYKIISSRNRADSIISGQISSVRQALLSIEREMGTALEREVELRAVVNWKNLKTGQLLIDNRSVIASGSYSTLQRQDFKYASSLAANNLARRIVELMEEEW